MNESRSAGDSASRTLVIGHGGLLGAAVSRALRTRGPELLTPRIRWAAPEEALDLERAFRDLTAPGGRWRIFWCAGAGIPSTSRPVFEAELLSFARFCDVVARSGLGSEGSLFFSSSAGALYAGSQSPPFSEYSAVEPLSPYGLAKVEFEGLVSRLTDSGVRVAIGRIANLYGPGQKLGKQQGLISQLCLSAETGRPLGIYVPLDTLRDYLFVEDAAAIVIEMLDRVSRLPPGAPPVTKILASGRSVSIAGLLGEFRLVIKRRPPVILAASPLRSIQARDLRMKSMVWPDVDRRQLTPLVVGIDACLRDVSQRWRARLT